MQRLHEASLEKDVIGRKEARNTVQRNTKITTEMRDNVTTLTAACRGDRNCARSCFVEMSCPQCYRTWERRRLKTRQVKG